MASCTMPVSEGMGVETHSASIGKSRKTILELFMSNYYDSGYENGQKEETQFMHWVNHYGLDVKTSNVTHPA